MNGKLNGIKKIAILRANALGDLIFSLPAIKALKDTYPSAEIVFLGKKWHKDFLINRTPVDRVIVIPKAAGVGEEEDYKEDTAELNNFFKKVKGEKFDIAIQLHGGGRFSNPFILNLGAKLTIGLKNFDAPPLDKWIPYVYYQNEIFRYLEVVSLIGARTLDLEPKIKVLKDDLDEAMKVFSKIKPFVVIHPGATDLRRRWNTDKFASVGDILRKNGYEVLITGLKNEEKIISQVIAKMEKQPINLCGKLSLGGFCAILSMSNLVISNDTGPLHLATAVGAKTVGIYWCGNLINGGPISRKNNRPLISWQINCPLCRLDVTRDYQPKTKHCSHLASFVENVNIDEVAKSSLDLLLGT